MLDYAMPIQMTVSCVGEFEAYRGAAICGDTKSLAEALTKIDAYAPNSHARR